MNTNAKSLCEKSDVRPEGARFSSGSRKKHPEWGLFYKPINNPDRIHPASIRLLHILRTGHTQCILPMRLLDRVCQQGLNKEVIREVA